ncbi:DUF2142 domain-containing protein [Xylanimonas allomyrinae]|uniref:DUF2142 domain-containing protein n=1 Tax=Xylanimonas allomyrinae TaxID=2509459 RepID=A0A4P6EL35_9MICO|nr:DUF2142 domain-containing protein [Xylanimonas allomyrinae]QAY63372.1 DUF2142 domain-containing protein [Xylanimonas allomyrinae]
MNDRHARRSGARSPSGRGPVRSSRAWRAGAAAVTVIGALLFVFSWATASPPGSSPDEDWHLASIWCPTPLDGACSTKVNDDQTTSVKVPQKIVSAAACTAFNPAASGACVDGLGTEPAWTNRVDNGAYPGGFYDVMHWFVGGDMTASVMMMRLVNGTLGVALLGALVALLSPGNRRLVAYGGLVVAAPMVVYLVASINPSGWAITGVAAAWIGLHGFFTESQAWRRYTLAGLAAFGAVLAAASRGDAGAFAALVAVAATVLHLDRIRADLKRVAAPVVVAAIGVAGFLSGTQSSAVSSGLTDYPPGDLGLLLSNIRALPALLLDSLTGPLNWLDTPMPAITWVPVTMLATALVFWGLQSMNWRKGIALLGMVVAFCALPLLLLQVSGAPVGAEVQGRYLTPIVPVIVMTALWNPIRNGVDRLTRVQTLVVAVALVVANAAALHTQIRRFVTGLDAPYFNLDWNVEWWASPVSPMATLVLGSLGFAILVIGLFLVRGSDLPDIPDAGGTQDPSESGDESIAQAAPAR